MRKLIARLSLRITGWRLAGEVPDTSAVIIGASHTSNWDFPKLLVVKWMWDFGPRWIGKHTLFRGPFDWIFRYMGGIPVDRTRPGRVVDQMRELFESSDVLHLVITPEGTRRATPMWKSGFYHIAQGAHVPVVLGFVDYRTRRFGLGPSIRLTGNVGSDMDTIRDFYRDKVGCRPKGTGPVRLREESE